jgi:ABC-type phosphate/phosphonate transport system substrate-binding protein
VLTNAFALRLALSVCGLALLPAKSIQAGNAKTLQIGLDRSLFRDTPQLITHTIAQAFKYAFENHVGLCGEVKSGTDALTLARQLHDREVHVALFSGHEFAWAREQYPDLQPLVVVSSPYQRQACLVVSRASRVESVADLKGKVVSMPRRVPSFCRLFLERSCGIGNRPEVFYSKMERPADSEDALEDVIDGQVGAALVHVGHLEAFKTARPDRYAKLKELARSELFPPIVLAYDPKGLGEAQVRTIRTGMLEMNKTRQGQEFLNLCRMRKFEAAPRDFEQLLHSITKAYPSPEPKPAQ